MSFHHHKYEGSINLLTVLRFAMEDERSYLYDYIMSRIEDNNPLSNLNSSMLDFITNVNEKYDVIERGLNEHLRKFYKTNNINCTFNSINEITINYTIEVKFDDSKELNRYKLKAPERYEFLTNKEYHGEQIF